MIRLVLGAGALCAALAATALAAAPQPGSQEAQSFTRRITKTVTGRYLLYLPPEYGKDTAKRWPLLLFLHGAGERGNDLEKLKVHGPPKLVSQGKEFPFIIVSPQCPEESWWSAETETLGALLDEIQSRYRVDPDRVYVTGLSMGGMGTWALALAYPNRFAALAPICGGGGRRGLGRISHIPVWAFHGAKDNVVPLAQMQETVDALKAAKGTVKLTIYPEAEHDSWTETYNNPELFEWLLQQKRRKPEPNP